MENHNFSQIPFFSVEMRSVGLEVLEVFVRIFTYVPLSFSVSYYSSLPPLCTYVRRTHPHIEQFHFITRLIQDT